MSAPILSTRRVTDFVWRDEHPWHDTGTLRLAELGSLWGQFALHSSDGAGRHLLARDRLGVNKLFFAITAESEVVSSNYLVDLLQAGHRLEDVWSVPAGHAIRLAPARGEYRMYQHAQLDFPEEAAVGTGAFVLKIRAALTRTFERLAQTLAGRRLFVTLSGGLDSTVVAILASEYLGDLTALTFTMGSPERPDSDLAHARLVAETLGIPLEVVSASPDEVVDLLDTVLIHGQDWRDFNVHCGLVNAAIGRWLREQLGDDDGQPAPVLLTGDTMNELMADYSPVEYRGVEYYSLPRLDTGRLRRVLVAGLDAGDREVGIFNAFGIETVQPYALAAEAYAAVPDAWLASPLAKQQLVRHVLGDCVPSAVYDRPKVRAQVGSSGQVGGTLAAIADRGIDGAGLRRRFAELLDVEEQQLAGLIRGGQYRFTARPPWEARQR